MSSISITVTEASRNFADCVNRAHYQHQTFILLKNGVPVAQLSPMVKPECTARDLAAALAEVEISPAEARAWHRDLNAGLRKLKPPIDKWQ
jgi:antitoxin (DNA-binding transcriptional repressor) of toxin-antitoxin stability system